MWDSDLGGRAPVEGAEEVGDQAVPVVPEEAQRAHFGKVYVAVVADTEDLQEGLDDAQSFVDDAFWSFWAFHAPFRWQNFVNWWAARRYVEPRDPRRR